MDSKTRKVLIVEDDVDLLDTLALFLKEESYTVKALKKASGFQKHLEKFLPDIVLLDVKLLGEDGDLIAQKLNDHPRRRDFKIVLMSAWDDLAQRAEAARVDAYLKKPFHLQSLLDVLTLDGSS